jgi:hypothetical protein
VQLYVRLLRFTQDSSALSPSPGHPAELPRSAVIPSVHRRWIYKVRPSCEWRTSWLRAHSSQAYHTSYPVRVPRPAPPFHASFRPHLTVTPLRFPCPSAPRTPGRGTFTPKHDSMHGTHAEERRPDISGRLFSCSCEPQKPCAREAKPAARGRGAAPTTPASTQESGYKVRNESPAGCGELRRPWLGQLKYKVHIGSVCRTLAINQANLVCLLKDSGAKSGTYRWHSAYESHCMVNITSTHSNPAFASPSSWLDIPLKRKFPNPISLRQIGL